MTKSIVTARKEGRRKRKRPQTRFEENGNKIFAYSGQTPKGMEEEEEEEEEKKIIT
jgi:hypothetical protein